MVEPPPPEALQNPEANPLTAALVSRVAAQHGIRVLVIKGLSLEFHELRPGYISADVDVLVEPDRFDSLVAALATDGWEARPSTALSTRLPHHSDTLLNPQRPNDIDVHSHFPGLLVTPRSAFDTLWENRVQVSLAGGACWIPDRISAIVIWALHSLRSTSKQPRHEAELSQLVDDVLPALSAAESQELARRIVSLGALRPLRAIPAVESLVDACSGALEVDGAYADWQQMIVMTHSRAPFIQALRSRPLRDWPWLIRWGVWPPREDLKLIDPSMVDTTVGRLKARSRRLTGFIRRLLMQ